MLRLVRGLQDRQGRGVPLSGQASGQRAEKDPVHLLRHGGGDGGAHVPLRGLRGRVPHRQLGGRTGELAGEHPPQLHHGAAPSAAAGRAAGAPGVPRRLPRRKGAGLIFQDRTAPEALPPGPFRSLGAHAGAGLLDDAVHDVAGEAAGDVTEDVAVRVDHEGGGEGADAVLGEDLPRLVHHGGIGVALFRQPIADLPGGEAVGVAGAVGVHGVRHTQHHHLAGVFAPVLIKLLDLRHLPLAGAAPGGPEVQKHHLALVVGEGVLLAVLVHQGEVRRGGQLTGGGGTALRRGGRGALAALALAFAAPALAARHGGGLAFRLGGALAHGGGALAAGAGNAAEVGGEAVHPAGEHHHAHQDEQHAARPGGPLEPAGVALEEGQHLAGEQAHRQERQHEAQGVDPDEHKA